MTNLKILSAPKGSRKDSKRVGRGPGSGWGCTSGYGNKGAQARSGYRRKGSFEGGQIPLLRRLPKFGFNNTQFAELVEEVNVSDIEKIGVASVDRKVLLEKGLLANERSLVKVLGVGEITHPIILTVDKISASAKEKIEKAGGKVTLVEHVTWKRARKA